MNRQPEIAGAPILLLRDNLHGDYSEIIGESSQMFEVMQQIENFAPTPMRVLISGETGTGKELVARALHKNSGRAGKMVSFNCAAVPASLIENELFGHEQGAFTGADTKGIGKFERASGGTLFLDEIGEMSLSLQPKLLRAIETGEIERLGGTAPIRVDVRIIAATNSDLSQAVQAGTFREDLYYRLNVATISVPSLAERNTDIQGLVAYFLKKHWPHPSPDTPRVAPETLHILKSYLWPGNVRELENVIERASHLIKGTHLLPKHLPARIQSDCSPATCPTEEVFPISELETICFSIGTSLALIEKTAIRATLLRFDGNRTQTAAALKIDIRTLQRKLKQYEI